MRLAVGREGYVEPGAEEPEYAGSLTVAFWFLASAAVAPSFGTRFRSRRLTMGRRQWSRLGRGDFLRRCFYLRGRFWRGSAVDEGVEMVWVWLRLMG